MGPDLMADDRYLAPRGMLEDGTDAMKDLSRSGASETSVSDGEQNQRGESSYREMRGSQGRRPSRCRQDLCPSRAGAACGRGICLSARARRGSSSRRAGTSSRSRTWPRLMATEHEVRQRAGTGAGQHSPSSAGFLTTGAGFLKKLVIVAFCFSAFCTAGSVVGQRSLQAWKRRPSSTDLCGLGLLVLLLLCFELARCLLLSLLLLLKGAATDQLERKTQGCL